MRRTLLVVAALCAACSPTPRPPNARSEPAAPPWRLELAAQLAADPGDQGALYLAAYVAGEGGDAAGALTMLTRLDALGWDFPLPEADFPSLAKDERFRALAARVAARVPSGGPAQVVLTVPPADLGPEGIACDAEATYLGSINHRKVVRVDAAGPRDLVPPRRDGTGGVLGMTLDAPRGRLWFAHNPVGREPGRSGVTAVDARTGAAQVAATLDGEHLLNDVAVTAEGELYITDSAPGAVWRVRAGGRALERVVPDGTFMYPNGLVWIAEQRRLVVADAAGLHVLDPATGAHRRVARGPAPTLGGVDGLARHDDSFIAVVNGYRGERVMRWRFDPATLAVVAVERLQGQHPSFAVPTTGCVVGDRYRFIANSYIGERDRDGNFRDPSRLRPVEVLELSLR